jgi:hypothetical protein
MRIGTRWTTKVAVCALICQYDIHQGYTFNMAEFSIKRDPDEAFPFRDGPGADRGAGLAEEPLDRHLAR